MQKIRPQVYKTIVVLLKNKKVNYAVLKNNELLKFEEIPMSIRTFRREYGKAYIVKSIYRERLNHDSICSQYAEVKENGLVLGLLLNYKKKMVTAIAKSALDEQRTIKLTGKFSMKSPLFQEIYDDVFSNFKKIFNEVKNYYVTETMNGSVRNISVVKNPNHKFSHPNTFSLKKDGKLTEFGKLWGWIKQI